MRKKWKTFESKIKYLFPVPGIISAMASYEETKTCENYFQILRKVENMEKVKCHRY